MEQTVQNSVELLFYVAMKKCLSVVSENSLADIVLSSLLTLNFSIIKRNILFLCNPYLTCLLLFPFRPLFFLHNIEIVESFGNIKDFAYRFQISVTVAAELKKSLLDYNYKHFHKTYEVYYASNLINQKVSEGVD